MINRTVNFVLPQHTASLSQTMQTAVATYNCIDDSNCCMNYECVYFIILCLARVNCI